MTTPLTKLIEENKERPIAEAPRDGSNWLLLVDGEWIVGYWGKTTLCSYSTGEYQERWLTDGPRSGITGNITHFRPLPDDRLANCFEILLNAALSAKEQNHIYEAAADIEVALQQIIAIAEGKDNESIG